MGTSTFCLFMCCQRLMKVVFQCQNQDALRSALRRPATSQNNAGSKHPDRPRSVFRQEWLRTMSAHSGKVSSFLCGVPFHRELKWPPQRLRACGLEWPVENAHSSALTSQLALPLAASLVPTSLLAAHVALAFRLPGRLTLLTSDVLGSLR